MRTIYLIALFAACPLAAQVVTFQFTGQIDFIQERFAGSSTMYVNQPDSDTYGFNFALGQQVTGTFSYDLSAADLGEGSRGQFRDLGALSLQVAAAGYDYSAPSSDSTILYLYNDSSYSDGPDALEFVTSVQIGSVAHKASVNLRDNTGTALTSFLVPPSSLDLTAFSYEKIFLTLAVQPEFLSTGLLNMTIQMSTLSLVAVPEPAGVAALIGLAVLGVVLVRRRY